MQVDQALKTRKSVRRFLPRDVDNALITRVLDAARWAASGTNTQPWQVIVTKGATKERVCTAIEQAYRSGQPAKMDFHYYPDDWHEPYLQRRRECGARLYAALDIKREDKVRRQEQWVANYRAFDAPVALFFFLDSKMEIGSFMDYGMFLQSVMLAAVHEGLATCPQAALGEYPDIVRDVLGVSGSSVVLCGMAMGYEDIDDPVNNYRTSREAVDQFTQFLD